MSKEYYSYVPKNVEIPGTDDLPKKHENKKDRWGEPLITSIGGDLQEFGDGVRWRSIEKIGAGSFSEVWKGFDGKLEKEVALKIAKGASRKVLEREAKQMANLSHPAIPEIHDFTISEDDDESVMVMELVSGVDFLQADITDSRELLRVGRELADVLDYLSSEGIMHGDVQALNILYSPGEQIKLLDFGISTGVLDRRDINIIPRFPEQDIDFHDTSGDVFALAQVMTEKMTGKTYPLLDLSPVEGSYLQNAWRSSLLPEVIPVMEKALSADPVDRFGSATEFMDALEAVYST